MSPENEKVILAAEGEKATASELYVSLVVSVSSNIRCQSSISLRFLPGTNPKLTHITRFITRRSERYACIDRIKVLIAVDNSVGLYFADAPFVVQVLPGLLKDVAAIDAERVIITKESIGLACAIASVRLKGHCARVY